MKKGNLLLAKVSDKTIWNDIVSSGGLIHQSTGELVESKVRLKRNDTEITVY